MTEAGGVIRCAILTPWAEARGPQGELRPLAVAEYAPASWQDVTGRSARSVRPLLVMVQAEVEPMAFTALQLDRRFRLVWADDGRMNAELPIHLAQLSALAGFMESLGIPRRIVRQMLDGLKPDGRTRRQVADILAIRLGENPLVKYDLKPSTRRRKGPRKRVLGPRPPRLRFPPPPVDLCHPSSREAARPRRPRAALKKPKAGT